MTATDMRTTKAARPEPIAPPDDGAEQPGTTPAHPDRSTPRDSARRRSSRFLPTGLFKWPSASSSPRPPRRDRLNATRELPFFTGDE
mmetsp:Transcript_6896/g.22175  ORF Transcript_6896/g.22175 Transcript_6896/m.22175 type:complete len:87 (+) Transcript_6896:362-622(+)